MLSETHSMSVAVGIVLAASLLAQAHAQEERTKPIRAPGALSAVGADQQAQALRDAQDMVNNILRSYQQLSPQVAEDLKFMPEVARRIDDIADQELALERARVLEFMGIDPNASTNLYYFVSWSMPLELLRSYALEAMWSGGTLVIKGVPPGKELGEFITGDLRHLVYGKGAAANISIDPRLFDAYGVTAVPTIVYTTVRDNMQCQGVNPVSFEYADKTYSYDTCPLLDPSLYWKMSGAVTSAYALQTFADAGAPGVQAHLQALGRAWQGRVPLVKEQVGFTGAWEDALSPQQVQAVRDGVRSVLPQ
jgi:type-F conjugative transfer system pilin assembly protein TrbC